MPLFEYRCARCDSTFEQLIRNGERAVCPRCGGGDPERLLSAAAAHTGAASGLSVLGGCPPSDAPPCHPGCCRL